MKKISESALTITPAKSVLKCSIKPKTLDYPFAIIATNLKISKEAIRFWVNTLLFKGVESLN